jgi:hypothetical protein
VPLDEAGKPYPVVQGGDEREPGGRHRTADANQAMPGRWMSKPCRENKRSNSATPFCRCVPLECCVASASTAIVSSSLASP